MSGWRPLPGHTLLVPSGSVGLHLFILILGPVVLPSYGGQAQLAMVSMTTLRPGIPHDPACVLQPGDHPFIRHPSYVAYRHLRLDQSLHVETMIDRAVWTLSDACTPELLARITAGVCTSKLTAREFKRLFRCP
jgi:hypothetical protein